MKKPTTILALMALSAVCATAGVEPAPSGKGGAGMPPPADPCATPIGYTSVELLYANTDFGLAGSSDGVAIKLEYSLMSNFFLTAAGSYADVDGGDFWTLTGGIGGYLQLFPGIHAAADVGVLHMDSEYDYLVPTPVKGTPGQNVVSFGDSDTGWYIRPHLRGKWGCFEVHVGAMYADVNDEDWNMFVQAYYQVMPNWDITVGYNEWDELDAETWNGGVRYRF